LEPLKGGKVLDFPCNFLLLCMNEIAPCRIGLYFMTLLVLCSITRSSWSINSIRCSKWKRTFSNSNFKDDKAHWGKNFQNELILGAIGDHILLDNRTGWIHKVECKIKVTRVKNERTPWGGYLFEFDDNKALLGQNGYMKTLVKPQ
jgi:hypothetical protein